MGRLELREETIDFILELKADMPNYGVPRYTNIHLENINDPALVGGEDPYITATTRWSFEGDVTRKGSIPACEYSRQRIAPHIGKEITPKDQLRVGHALFFLCEAVRDEPSIARELMHSANALTQTTQYTSSSMDLRRQLAKALAPMIDAQDIAGGLIGSVILKGHPFARRHGLRRVLEYATSHDTFERPITQDTPMQWYLRDEDIRLIQGYQPRRAGL